MPYLQQSEYYKIKLQNTKLMKMYDQLQILHSDIN